MQEAGFAQYGKLIVKSFKNCFIWFNQVPVFWVVSWNHYTEIFMNFGQALIVMKITVLSFH